MGFKLPNSSIKSAISTTGYKSNSPDVDNDVNIIPSNKITMKGVDFPVKGVGSNGVTKNMKPGKDYDFGDADYVVETKASPITSKLKTALDIGSNLLKGTAGVAASMLSTTAAAGGQESPSEQKKKFLDISNDGGPLPFPTSVKDKDKDKDTASSSPVKQSNKRTKGKDRHFRKPEEGAGMTSAGVASYRKQNPGSKLKTAVTGKVKAGSKAAGRRKSFCARSKGWTGERGKAARARWKC